VLLEGKLHTPLESERDRKDDSMTRVEGRLVDGGGTSLPKRVEEEGGRGEKKEKKKEKDFGRKSRLLYS